MAESNNLRQRKRDDIWFKSEFRELRWHTQQKADLLVLNPTFLKYVKNIRRDFNIPDDSSIDWDEGAKGMLWWNKVLKPREKEWDEAIKALLIKCNLLSGWFMPLSFYIRNNVLEAPPALRVVHDKDMFGNDAIKIEVNDYSNLEDLKYVQSIIHRWRQDLGYQKKGQIVQPIPKFKYYMRMLELERLNATEQEIADTLNDEEPQDSKVAFTKKIVHDDLIFIKRKIAEQMT